MTDDFALPCRMDKMIDEIEVGAALKSLETDVVALLVDWVDDGPSAIVAMPKKRFLREPKTESDCCPSRLKDYRFVKLTPCYFVDWLVLANGHGILLIE